MKNNNTYLFSINSGADCAVYRINEEQRKALYRLVSDGWFDDFNVGFTDDDDMVVDLTAEEV